MKLKIILTVVFNLGLTGLLFQGGSGGCGGGPPAAAATLEGTYDCVDGCDGDCIFSDTIEFVLGESEDEGNTNLSVIGSISTDSSTFDVSAAAGVNDDGNFGFNLDDLNGGGVDCIGPPVVDDLAIINCAGEEKLDDVFTTVTCQQATYSKR